MHTDHHDHMPPNFEVDPLAVKLGHEPDVVKPGRILYVAAALVILFAVTYVIVTLLVRTTLPSYKETAGDRAGPRNRVSPDQGSLNKRLERISSTDPNAEYKQPRLEGLQQFSHKDDPPYFRSSPPVHEDENAPLDQRKNSPHYHPEQLRPDGEAARALGLQSYGWKDPKEKTQVRIPLNEAMKLLAEGSHDKSEDSKARALYQKWLKSDGSVKLKDFGVVGPTASTPIGITYPSGDAKGHGHDHGGDAIKGGPKVDDHDKNKKGQGPAAKSKDE